MCMSLSGNDHRYRATHKFEVWQLVNIPDSIVKVVYGVAKVEHGGDNVYYFPTSCFCDIGTVGADRCPFVYTN